MKRTFFAVKIKNFNLLPLITQNIDGIRRTVKLANPENPHITLKFLGDTQENDIPKIDTLLRQKLADIRSFSFMLEGTGCFPRPSHPRVLWLGISKGLKNLQKTHKLIENVTTKFHYKPDKRYFKPHLTYGRVKRYKKTVIHDFLDYSYDPVKNYVDTIIWYESNLTPKGAIHNQLRKYKLK